jgi:hypothetical protein
MSPSETPKSKSVGDSFNNMNPNGKSLTLVVVGYIVTMVVSVFIIAFAIMNLMDVSNCNTMSQALVVLWIILAIVFLTSLVLVAVMTRKFFPSPSGCLPFAAVYGIVLLVSYVIMAFCLMVAFNC